MSAEPLTKEERAICLAKRRRSDCGFLPGELWDAIERWEATVVALETENARLLQMLTDEQNAHAWTAKTLRVDVRWQEREAEYQRRIAELESLLRSGVEGLP